MGEAARFFYIPVIIRYCFGEIPICFEKNFENVNTSGKPRDTDISVIEKSVLFKSDFALSSFSLLRYCFGEHFSYRIKRL